MKLNTQQPIILGIESSCDETAASIVSGGHCVLSNVVATQHELHEEFGGVVPEIASRAHIKRIYPVINEALRNAHNITPDMIDAIAVGHRPGLIGSLLVGVSAAKALAWAWQKPLIGIDHVIAHLHATSLLDNIIYSNTDSIDTNTPSFPAIGVVLSGGHTSIFYMHSGTEITQIGKTIDDAIGEAYDKAATILGLGFPGGPEVDKYAGMGDENAYQFPVAMLDKQSLDFSYSGLKTSLLYKVRGNPVQGKKRTFARNYDDLSSTDIANLCASFQKAAVRAVTKKIERTLEQLNTGSIQKINNITPDIRSIILGGGVTANSKVRAEIEIIAHNKSLDCYIPELKYCVDNAAMIAGIAASYYNANQFDDLTLNARPAGTF